MLDKLPITNIQLAEEYKICKSLKALSIKYNCSIKLIRGRLVKENVEIYHKFPPGKRYFIDESYFETIDTPAKAYFLGLFYADGYNNEPKSTTAIALQEVDKYILDKFAKEIRYDSPLRLTKKRKESHQEMYRIYLYNSKMSKNLANKGVVNKKSLILKFPTEEQVPSHLIHHFIRGYFDGDGSICISNGYKAITFTGTFEFLTSMKKIIDSDCIDNNNKLYKKTENNTYVLNYGSQKQIAKIHDYLYQDCEDLYLKRKKEKF